jgi:adenosine deaminase
MAKSDKVDIGFKNSEELLKHFKKLTKQGLASLLTKGFGLVTSLTQTAKNLEFVAFEEVYNLKQEGIIYAEIRFAPQYHCQGTQTYYRQLKTKNGKLSYREIIAAVANGLNQGYKTFGVPTKLIVCIGREIEPKKGIEIARAAIKCQDLGVVAIDLACDEAKYPPNRHSNAFVLTLDSGLKRTVHAGEFGHRKIPNMWDAVSNLCADRLGHAIDLISAPKLIETVRERDIGIEMCPLSNLFTGAIKYINELKINELLKQNVLVTINSDDPKMFGYTLSDTLKRVAKTYGFGKTEIKTLLLNSVRIAFCDDELKKALEKKILNYFE